MKRTFKIYFEIFSKYDTEQIIYLGNVKAKGSTNEYRMGTWGNLEKYEPTLIIEDNKPHKVNKKVLIYVKIKSQIKKFIIRGDFFYNGTYMDDINDVRIFKNDIHVKIKNIESIHSGFHIPKISSGLNESYLHSITYEDINQVNYLSRYFIHYNKQNGEEGPLLKIVSIVSNYDGYVNSYIVFYQTIKENGYISI